MAQHLISVLFGDPFAVMNTIGLIAFALVGSAKAIREEFDLFGLGREAEKKLRTGIVQIAVVASMLMGSITGSAAANTATTREEK